MNERHDMARDMDADAMGDDSDYKADTVVPGVKACPTCGHYAHRARACRGGMGDLCDCAFEGLPDLPTPDAGAKAEHRLLSSGDCSCGWKAGALLSHDQALDAFRRHWKAQCPSLMAQDAGNVAPGVCEALRVPKELIGESGNRAHASQQGIASAKAVSSEFWPVIPDFMVNPLVFRDANLGIVLVAGDDGAQMIYTIHKPSLKNRESWHWCTLRKVDERDGFQLVDALNVSRISPLPEKITGLQDPRLPVRPEPSILPRAFCPACRKSIYEGHSADCPDPSQAFVDRSNPFAFPRRMDLPAWPAPTCEFCGRWNGSHGAKCPRSDVKLDLSSVDDYLCLQALNDQSDRLTGVLNRNGGANLTVCPHCRVDDFTHVEGCDLSPLSDKYPGMKRLWWYVPAVLSMWIWPSEWAMEYIMRVRRNKA